MTVPCQGRPLGPSSKTIRRAIPKCLWLQKHFGMARRTFDHARQGRVY